MIVVAVLQAVGWVLGAVGLSLLSTELLDGPYGPAGVLLALLGVGAVVFGLALEKAAR